MSRVKSYRGTTLIRNRPPPPKDPSQAQDIGLRYGPRRGVFLMSEVPLQLRAWMRTVKSCGKGLDANFIPASLLVSSLELSDTRVYAP